MKVNTSRLSRQSSIRSKRGFTVVEVLVGSTIMLTIVLITLSIYSQTNRVSVDQQQLAEVQQEIRFAMYFISREIKSAGAGLPEQFAGHFFQGVNSDPNQTSAPVQTDRLTILANSDPLRLAIESYSPGSNTIILEPNEFDFYPYTENAYPADPAGYVNRVIIIFPNPELNNQNGELGQITGVDIASRQITFNRINTPLPNGLAPGGVAAEYVGGTVFFTELKIFWLDVDGAYPGLSPGTDGYLGQAGVLYVSQWNPANNAYEHLPIAQNVEDLQMQYHGDLDGDQLLDDNNADGEINQDDFLNWDDNIAWTDNPTVVDGIQSVGIWILGKTKDAFRSFAGTPPDRAKYIYGKPLIADSPHAESADKHRRFLLESTINIRTMSLNIYNTGVR